MSYQKPSTESGVVGVTCACCGETVIIINRRAYDGDPEFCRACLDLPEEQAETMILRTRQNRGRDESSPRATNTHIPG